MKQILLLSLLFLSCTTGKLKVLTDLPKSLKEVSGTETITNSDLIWMLNDSDNKPILFGLNEKGKIKKEVKINAKNHDWEDLSSDEKGNLYIGDFGNNYNNRKNLAILKVDAESLNGFNKVDVERIAFSYPKQQKFPPKKKQMYFDCEAFFCFKDTLYLFTKSRVKGDFGKTDLYKIPAKEGHHLAQYISSFNSCGDFGCWITSADISNDGQLMALLTPKSVFLFSNFSSNNFFNGTVKQYDFEYESQKEGVCFKDHRTLYITDEKAHGKGGNLYEFYLN